MIEDYFQAEPIPVKICGVTKESDAGAIVELGANALGFNFWEKSKRYFGPVAGEDWLKELRTRVLRVGVFVNASLDTIRELVEDGWIDAAQLHGEETPEDCRALREAGIPFLRAVGVKDSESVAELGVWETPWVLLDAFAPEARGGTGRRFDPGLARRAVQDHSELHIVLSGGLDPGNVGAAVREVRPAGVDVASGVEDAPGVKDLEKVRRFIEEARGAG